MKNLQNSRLTMMALASSLALVGCGGGGSSASVSTTSPAPVVTVPAPVVSAADIQTVVPAATYAAGSEEAKFFALFNDFRSKLGLGLVAQSAQLDLAAKNHLAYVTTYSTVNGGPVDMAAIDPKSGRPTFHIEDSAKAGFTGAQEMDRAAYAMYPLKATGFVGEEGAYGLGLGATVSLGNNIAAVYHRVGLMAQYMRDIGLAFGGDTAQTTVIEQGYTANQQKNASDYFGVYPANGQTGIKTVAYVETPNPFPDLAYADYATKTSFPISVSSQYNTKLTVTTFTVTEAGQTTPLSARLLVNSTNADTATYIPVSAAFIVGNAPFKSNTTYNVSFSGAINGVAKNMSWSFVTGV